MVSDMADSSMVGNDLSGVTPTVDRVSTTNEWKDINKKFTEMLSEKDIQEFLAYSAEASWSQMSDVRIDPEVKKVVNLMIGNVAKLSWGAGWLAGAEEVYENDFDDTVEKIPQQRGAEKLINDFGYMWEFLV